MRKSIAILMLSALVTGGLFAEIAFGISGVQYYQKDANGNWPSLRKVFEDFRDGQGVFYGIFGELMVDKLGLGLSFNYQPPAEYEAYNYYALYMYDVSLYVSYHLLGASFFLDPFVEGGFGVVGIDYFYKEYDLTKDDPLMASAYLTFGAGFGVTMKPFGVFLKANFVQPAFGNLKGRDDSTGQEYPIPSIDDMLLPLRWTLGVKLIF